MRSSTITPSGLEIQIDLRHRRHRKNVRPRGNSLFALLLVLRSTSLFYNWCKEIVTAAAHGEGRHALSLGDLHLRTSVAPEINHPVGVLLMAVRMQVDVGEHDESASARAADFVALVLATHARRIDTCNLRGK